MEGDYFKTLPIIALTANAISGMRETLLQGGFNDYLAKPVEIKKLNEIMDKWVPEGKREKVKPQEVSATASPFDFEIEGLDLAAGLTLTGGSPQQYREVLLLCCEDADGRMELLRKTPDEASLPMLVVSIHAMKSALASIGAKALSKEAANLEAAGKEGDLVFVSEYLAGFTERVALLSERVRRALSEGEDVEDESGNAFETLDKRVLSQLKEALENENVHVADKCLDALSETARSTEVRNALSEISNQILTSEFSEAIRLTESLFDRVAAPPGDAPDKGRATAGEETGSPTGELSS
jgi:HPt (histidine-containing phosphotransfer) domain-containing protein